MMSFKSSTLLFAFAALFAFTGCSSKKEEPECEDPAASGPEDKKAGGKSGDVQVERISLQTQAQKDRKKNDWCRACVMSKMGFASCQKVYADEPGPIKDKDALKKKAREKACKDAGYPAAECPDKAVISAQCVGDEPPKGTVAPGAAVQNLFQALNPPAGKSPTDPESGSDKPQDKEKDPAKKEAPAKDDKPAAAVIE